jgi:membrane protein YdbS with pleckstrin-like domain
LAALVLTIIVMVNDMTIGFILGLVLFLIWVFVFIIGFFTIRLEYEMRYYIITDRSLRIRKGVWSILEQTLTFANIQNISIEQGPIQRMLGISTLVVETAGGGGAANPQQGENLTNYHRATLQGLENAQQFRDLILTYLKKLPSYSGLGAPDESESEYATASQGGFSQAEITALREILAEIKALRSSS